MPSRAASLNSGCVSGPGIAASKKLSISASSCRCQRGKKVVSAISGNATTAQPAALAWRSRSTSAGDGAKRRGAQGEHVRHHASRAAMAMISTR